MTLQRTDDQGRVFATPGSVNPNITCGGCGGIMDEEELQAQECAECGQRWPSPEPD